jgi:hypothetical protein
MRYALLAALGLTLAGCDNGPNVPKTAPPDPRGKMPMPAGNTSPPPPPGTMPPAGGGK